MKFLSNEMQRKLRRNGNLAKINNYLAGAAIAAAATAAIAAFGMTNYGKRCFDYAKDYAYFTAVCPGVEYNVQKGDTIDKLLYAEGITKKQIDAARSALSFRNYAFNSLRNSFDVNNIKEGETIEGLDYNKNGVFGK